MRIMTMLYQYNLNTSIRPKELFDEFYKRGNEVHYIFVSNNVDLNGICHKLYDFPFFPRSFPYLIQTFILMALLNKSRKFDIIITWSLLEGFVSVLFKYISGTKVVICIRGDATEVLNLNKGNLIKKTIYTKLLNFIEKFSLNKADGIIFLSKDNKKRIMERSNLKNASKVKTIYNNVNTNRIKKLSKEQGIYFGFDKVVGYVGGIGKIKGLIYLLEAIYKVKSEIPNIGLVIVGDGPDKQELISIINKLNLNKNVILTGFKDNPLKYMKGFDLMVLPSITEAFGYVLLESMYVRTPVFGSKVGGIPEVLKYDELLFEPRNSAELALKILEIFKNSDSYDNVLNLCNNRKKEFTFNWEDEMITTVESFLEG